MKKQPDDLAALIAELKRVTTEDGMTTNEFADATGRSPECCRKLIRKLLKAGKMRLVWKKNVRMDGRPIMVPAYQLT